MTDEPREPLDQRDDGPLRILTMDRPRALNAFDRSLYDAMAEALAGAARDDDVRAVLVTGAGRAFSAGQDLRDFAEPGPRADGPGGFPAFVAALEGFPKPLMAAVNGVAVGVGLTMLLHCDMVLVGEGARLAPSAAAAVARSALTFVCPTDHAAVQALLDALPAPGPASATGGTATVVLLTTGSPEEVEHSAALADARGLTCLAAGVQVGPADIGTDQALFLYAGDEGAFAQHRGDLDLLGASRWLGPRHDAAAELDLALFGLWYDAQLGLLRAFDMAERAGLPPAELVDLAVTRLRYVADGVEATARELAERDYPRGPASLAEHAPVLARLAESRRDARLGDGGLGQVARIVEHASSGPGSDRGLTALLDQRSE